MLSVLRAGAGVALGFILAALLAGQPVADPAYRRAVAAFQQGRPAEAETALRSLLKRWPADAEGLMLLGIVLDSEQRYGEAEAFYQRALRLAPHSSALLNNVANHYLAAGDSKRAEGLFRRVVALDPHDANANLHLAQMSVAGKNGVQALADLDRLPAPQQAEPVARLLRGQALALANRCPEADAVLGPLAERTARESSFSFSIGLAYAACKRYEAAESSFSRALETDPKNFDILYNLGLVARHAGDLERARQSFEIALLQRPNDPDALYGLAEVLAKAGHRVTAATLLYRLRTLAPKWAEPLLLLAHTTEEMEYFEDTATSYGEYLKLRPEDEVARREWAFALARAGNVKEGLATLREFVLKHPKDARGQFELAVAEAISDHRRALRHLDEALALDPALYPARYARGVIRFEDNELAPALADFQLLFQRDPQNARVLDWLGQILLRTDRADEAADVLKRALERRPDDRATLMHYSTALRVLKRTDELQAVLAKFKRSATTPDRRMRKGLFDFLDLTPEEQRARYVTLLKAAVTANPEDVAARVRWGKELLDEGQTADGIKVFQEILALRPDSSVLAQCGRILLRFEQYALATEFLRASGQPSLDLAIAVYHSVSPAAGLSEVERIPAAERRGDYYVLRAQMLDSLGQATEAAESLNRGIRAAPTRADMYFQAALFLIKHSRGEEAARLLADGVRLLPDSPDLRLAYAVALALVNRDDEALKSLAETEARWPEWYRPYLIHGLLLAPAFRSEEAIPLLETAIALGAREAEAYQYLALAITHAHPKQLARAETAILQAVALSPENPGVQWLAGKILVDERKYPAAADHLEAAVRLQPNSVEAHYLLLAAYRELGQQDKCAAEAKVIERLSKKRLKPGVEPLPLQRLLFDVQAPASGGSGE
jgi:tetratricopeptide (TPR) repeat protein